MAAGDLPSKVVFVDTNIFLHFRSFTDIDWPALVSSQSVVLTVAPVVLRELNEKKDESGNKLRQRAASALKKLEAIYEKESPHKVREGVTLDLQTYEPNIEYEQNGLDYKSKDDQLLAAVLAFRTANPESQLALVTDDLGLRVKAKPRGIQTLSMPNGLRLPEELDPSEKRIRELEQENAELKRIAPDLQLTFSNEEKTLEVRLESPISSSREEIEREKLVIRDKYKKYHAEKSNSKPDMRASLLALSHLGPTDDAITRYDSKLDEFYSAYDKYLASRTTHINREKLTVRLELVLCNEGTTPARDIDIFLHFPDGFQLFDAESVPKIPPPPSPPNRPQGRFDELKAISMRAFYAPPLMRDLGPFNVSKPRIERTNSYDVSFSVVNLKHHMEEEIPTLYVVFDSFESASSFQITYQIVAANVAKQIEGELNVVVRKPT